MRFWNLQLIRFACYEMPDGSFMGDKANVAYTNECIEFGWKPPDPRTEFDPALSPDGTRLAYVMPTEQFDIYVKDIGSESPIQITHHPSHDGSGFDGSPSWSPDGRFLAFMRSTPEGCGVFTQSITSRDVQKVAACTFHLESSVAWSPDGQYIAFADRAAVGQPFQIFLINLETQQIQPLTHPPSHYYGDLDPAFSPDGTRMVFSAVHPGQPNVGGLAILNIDLKESPKP